MGGIRKAVQTLIKSKFLASTRKPLETGAKHDSGIQLGPNGLDLLKNLEARALEDMNNSSKNCFGHVVTESCPPERHLQHILDQGLLDELRMDANPSVMFNVSFKSESRRDGEQVLFKLEETVNGDQKETLDFDSSPNVLRTYAFFHETNWKYLYQDLLRVRRIFWKGFLSVPWCAKQEQKRPTKPDRQASLSWSPEPDKTSSFQLDHPLVVEHMEMIPDFAPDLRAVQIDSDLSCGSVVLLLDSIRQRTFLKSSRLSLHPEIAPIQVSVMIGSPNPSQDLIDLKTFVTDLLVQEGLQVFNDATGFEVPDLLGIPFIVVMSEKSLEDGVLLIRDRETCWFEQIHLAHCTRKLVKEFQGREVPDTWTKVKSELGIETTAPPKPTNKRKTSTKKQEKN